MKRMTFLFTCFLLFTLFLSAQNTLSISLSVGVRIYINESNPVYIYLVNEESAKKPLTGVKSIVVYPQDKDMNAGYIEFSFQDIPKGIYGIRCFQDTNSNGTLDKGLFGPAEPWGMSWSKEQRSKWPKFKNYSFILEKDIDEIEIYLE